MDLKFDTMTVDTSAAQTYYAYVKNKLEGKQDLKYFNGKTFYHTRKEPLNGDLLPKLNKLADKLKEKIDLFAQLEYLIRKIPIEDTIIQINFIIKEIYYVVHVLEHEKEEIVLYHPSILMSSDSPLSTLGFMCKNFIYFSGTELNVGHGDSVTICYLFTELCSDAELLIETYFMDENELFIYEKALIFEVPVGTVGVVSELSDLDSAVDVLLTSSIKVPWRLQKILVQESVYEQFKNALKWKCNLHKQSEVTTEIETEFDYNGRIFIFDIDTGKVPQSTKVIIEAYRTRKELLSLFNEMEPHYLSLWANDIAEINEITQNVNSSVIWVNNFGDFRGPSRVSDTIYPYNLSPPIKMLQQQELTVLKQSWLKHDFESRRNILCKALDECSLLEPINDENDNIITIKNVINKIELWDTFVDVGKDYVCLGVPTPINLLLRSVTAFNIEIIKSVLLGNAWSINNKDETCFVNIFKKYGIPIFIECNVWKSDDIELHALLNYMSVVMVSRHTKVIWTNSGTIFAN